MWVDDDDDDDDDEDEDEDDDDDEKLVRSVSSRSSGSSIAGQRTVSELRESS